MKRMERILKKGHDVSQNQLQDMCGRSWMETYIIILASGKLTCRP